VSTELLRLKAGILNQAIRRPPSEVLGPRGDVTARPLFSFPEELSVIARASDKLPSYSPSSKAPQVHPKHQTLNQSRPSAIPAFQRNARQPVVEIPLQSLFFRTQKQKRLLPSSYHITENQFQKSKISMSVNLRSVMPE
jgi:hypothetical protein